MTDQTDQRRRVLITGATGNIGRMLVHGWGDAYDLTLLDRDASGDDSQKPDMDGIDVVDVADLDALTAAFQGIDTVVHLAGDAAPNAEWDSVLHSNIIGVRNVYEAARVAGVRRVVFASSNHAMGAYDRDGAWPVYPDQLQRPDSLYGVSKAFGETLGRYYHDLHGLDVICLRIGWSTTGDPMDVDEDVLHAMWLSPRDTVEVVRCAIEAEVTWGLFYAISDNPNRRWSMTNTTLELGYRPQDSWTDRADEPEQVVQGGEPAPENWPENS